MAVPGMAEPGLTGHAAPPPATTFPYYGNETLYYLDYLDTDVITAEHTLVAVPGGSYSMQVANSRAGLTVPPSDGRWARGGGFMLRPPGFEHAHVQLARARAVNAALQAGRLSVGTPTPPRGGTPAPPPQRPGEPSRASAELAAARKVNADLQARLARGEVPA